jgi:hypothetical protein
MSATLGLGSSLFCCLTPHGCQSEARQAFLDAWVPTIGVATGVAVIVAAYCQGVPFSAAFAGHIICMAIAFPILMILGRWSNQSSAQGQDPEAEQTKWTRRHLHGNFMSLAGLLMCMGYLFVFKAHWAAKKYFGYSFSTSTWASNPRITHAWIGYLIILLVLQQVTVGLLKYAGLSNGVRRFTFHGTLGKATVGLGCVNIIIGMVALGWNTTVIVLIGILLVHMAWFGAVYPFPGKELYVGKPKLSGSEKVPAYGGADVRSGMP